jgi:hypothetical protein
MAQRITAEFSTEDASSAAEALLQSEGFSCIRQRAVRETADSNGRERADPELGEGLSPDSPARASNERWSIAVQAPFGTAARVIEILKSNGAIAVHEESSRSRRRQVEQVVHRPESVRHMASTDESRLFSSVIGLPILIDNPAPLSALLGLPTLIRND